MDKSVLVICTSLNMGVQKNKLFGLLTNYQTMDIEFFCFIEGCWNTFGNIKFKYSCKNLNWQKQKMYTKCFTLFWA